MHRASYTAQTLSARVFDKLSCLSRFTAGLGKLELAALKANLALFVRGMSAIELHRLCQNSIDDLSPQSLVLLDVIRVENFGRKKDDRAFENARLVSLIPGTPLACGPTSGSRPALALTNREGASLEALHPKKEHQ